MVKTRVKQLSLAVLLLAVFAGLSAYPAAASTQPATAAAPGQAYWTGDAPGTVANDPILLAPDASGAGCPSNITTGSGKWACLNSQYDQWGYRGILRRGSWDSSTGVGWGWEKALNYHNLWQQPTLDTIELSATRANQANNTRYRYIAYHYNTQHQLDQEVVVVVTHVKTDRNSGTSPDSWAVGVYTAYCNNGSGSEEVRCPDWVNSTL
jgi:hypothetical protein